jgi:peroxiredoxin
MKKKILPGLFIFLNIYGIAAQDKKINVYAFMAEECPVSIFMAASLKTVAAMYDTDASFYLVFPVSSSSEKTASAFKEKQQLDQFNIIIDSSQQLTAKLGARVTPEVVITNRQSVIL